ncbi:MAG: class I SAM-dependent methyltransferase [Candidatus Marinimicrobia bacterium]|nr:class I SAM-dependent methyltransferase [Candidatus Neomarinimicrobiota bacterium]
MENINCIVCGKNISTAYIEVSDRLSKSPELFQLVKCDCNFVYLNPRPSQANISTYYNSPEYDPHNNLKNNKLGKLYKLVQSVALRFKFRRISSFHKSGKILDVGGGNGEFAAFMALQGWKVVLQDKISKIDNLRDRENIIAVQNLEKIKKDECFNVITLWHSLEHIHNIEELYSQINRLLKPDGILLIAIPNINAPEKPFFNNKWAPFDAPRHLYHFQLNTLNELCNRYKFEIVRKFSLFQDTPYNILLSLSENTPFQFLRGMLVFCYSIIVTILRGPEHSSSLLVICRKA